MEQAEMVALLMGVVGLAGVAFIIALTELVKVSWPSLDKRWWPLVSIVWGLLLNVFVAAVLLATGVTQGHILLVMGFAVIAGLMAGLSASGLYSGAKNSIGGGSGAVT